MLLAIQHGLRSGDILGLTLDDIEWNLKRISLVQKKTGRSLSLPLQEESALAIIDYLKNERPETDFPEIFITCNAPYRPLAESRGSVHAEISAAFNRAGVVTEGKHHGLHAIRHSLAVSLLGSNTPIPVLAEILGHTSSNATKNYLRVDVEKLRPLSLEVPNECR